MKLRSFKVFYIDFKTWWIEYYPYFTCRAIFVSVILIRFFTSYQNTKYKYFIREYQKKISKMYKQSICIAYTNYNAAVFLPCGKTQWIATSFQKANKNYTIVRRFCRRHLILKSRKQLNFFWLCIIISLKYVF